MAGNLVEENQADISEIFHTKEFINVVNFDYGMNSVFTLRQKTNQTPTTTKPADFARSPRENYRTQKDFMAYLPMWRFEAQNFESEKREDFEAKISEILNQCPRFVNTLESYTRYPADTSLRNKAKLKIICDRYFVELRF